MESIWQVKKGVIFNNKEKILRYIFSEKKFQDYMYISFHFCKINRNKKKRKLNAYTHMHRYIHIPIHFVNYTVNIYT